MAQRVSVVVTDDFDGTPGAVPVRFGLDGVEYEIDLKPENEDNLRSFLGAYIGLARKTGAGSGRRVARKASSGRSSGDETAAMREWAAANGYALGTRGRIPQTIKDAYHAARGGSAPAAELTAADITPSSPEFSQA